MGEIRIVPVRALDLRLELRDWAWAETNRTMTDMHFEKQRERWPGIWNGRVLLLHRFAIEQEIFRGVYLETDFASFLHWRDADFPDASVFNCFAMAALRAADGAFLLGRMAKHTANAGKVYFPSGTPDPHDVRDDGIVDLEGSVRRELLEETGLISTDAKPGGWHAMLAGARIALMHALEAPEDAETLAARVRVHLATTPRPELADVVIVRSCEDLTPAMPDFVRAYLEAVFAQR
ncbi:MAG TPA: NUDIX hydrolase [Xanthobacteraceae bacterium]|jgi:8-oxo-dGTP pyrophosphatase MutT (NUDIX family)